jgi:hypothetical protein
MISMGTLGKGPKGKIMLTLDTFSGSVTAETGPEIHLVIYFTDETRVNKEKLTV